jgi:signal transduction histidine kinase
VSGPRARSRWISLWLPVAWLPVWAFFVALIIGVHGDVGFHSGALLALRLIVAAAILTPLVQLLAARLPWPRPFRLRFVAIHLLAAAVWSLAWILLNSLLTSVVHARLTLALGVGSGPFLAMGMWLYVIVAGVCYAIRATELAARAETVAAQSQLAALRAQLNPHFLFNALHTVVHLIPSDPRRAARAAEELAGLLRVTLEEDRDLVTLDEEWAFVARYLDLERLRFGDRLHVRFVASEEARAALLPSFAVQTLVENAVRHGVAPSVEPTDVEVTAALAGDVLTVEVRDSGGGATAADVAASAGSGLRRLRERLEALEALHADGGGRGRRRSAARLDVDTTAGGGFTATLHIPQDPDGVPQEPA